MSTSRKYGIRTATITVALGSLAFAGIGAASADTISYTDPATSDGAFCIVTSAAGMTRPYDNAIACSRQEKAIQDAIDKEQHRQDSRAQD